MTKIYKTMNNTTEIYQIEKDGKTYLYERHLYSISGELTDRLIIYKNNGIHTPILEAIHFAPYTLLLIEVDDAVNITSVAEAVNDGEIRSIIKQRFQEKEIEFKDQYFTQWSIKSLLKYLFNYK